MELNAYNESLFSFLAASPSPYHAVANMKRVLLDRGFTPLVETAPWRLESGRGYVVTRDGAALVAFILGKDETAGDGFRMAAAHTDSPALKLKPLPEYRSGGYRQLGVEVYGGALLAPWFDRSLSLAGRVTCRLADGGLCVYLIDFDRPLLVLPSLAIHLDREANKSATLNQQQHLPPILGLHEEGAEDDFVHLLRQQLAKEHPGTVFSEVLACDLFCYDHQSPLTAGARGELISAPRLDNLLSCHAGLMALQSAGRDKNTLLFCANHEEIGSTSTSGANGSLLEAILERLLPEVEARRIALRRSFLISADNAHATHPNHADKADPRHEIHLNRGPVIKYNASQRYATEAPSAAVLKAICREAGITPQEFVMRSDLPCGSTIGPMTAARLGTMTVDIGAATLAMHSIREVTGLRDPYLLYSTLCRFFASDVHKTLVFAAQ